MELFNIVLNFLYPNVCGVCKKVCKNPICNNCMNKLNKDNKKKRKVYIQTNYRFIDEHIYLFRYKGIIRELMVKYKFKEESYLYKSFSYMILKNEKIMNYINRYDYILPIPIHKKRKKQRGFNQSELIVKDICKNEQRIKYEKDILIKIKNVKPQSSLNKTERKINILDAYEIDKSKIDRIKDSNILLFDDIFTTGSTANECAKVLKKYGARKVTILTIAKD